MPITLDDISVGWSFLNNPDGNGGYSFDVTEEGRTDVIAFKVAFNDLETFVNEVKGYPVSYGSSTSGTITRNVPMQHPWNKKLYAVRISGEGLGAENSPTRSKPYPYALVRVTFGTLTWEPEDPSTPFLDIEIQGGGNYITLPGVPFTYATSGKPLEQDFGKMVGELAFSVTRYDVPDLDRFQAIANPLKTMVNSAALTIGNTTYAAETVLFPTYSASRQNTGLGQRKHKVTLQLIQRDLNWNKVLAPSGSYDYLTPKPYDQGDLSVLFSAIA